MTDQTPRKGGSGGDRTQFAERSRNEGSVNLSDSAKTTPCPVDEDATHDFEGWCSAYGWDCADFQSFLDDEDSDEEEFDDEGE